MKYAMYVVLAFWYLCSMNGLVGGIYYLTASGISPLRPIWSYFASFAFDVVVTSILLWVFMSGVLGDWPTIITGTLLLGAEAAVALRAQRTFKGEIAG